MLQILWLVLRHYPFSFTQRVTEITKVLKDLQNGKYETAMVANEGI